MTELMTGFREQPSKKEYLFDTAVNLLHMIDMTETREEVFKDALLTKVTMECGEDARENIQKVIGHIEIAHAGATRKGNPQMKYIIHPLRVALRYAHGFRYHQLDDLTDQERKTRFLDGIKICLGHDTMEETNFSFTNPEVHADFGETAIAGIQAMTITDGEKKEAYFARLKEVTSIKAYDRIDNILDFVELYTRPEPVLIMGSKPVSKRLQENLNETKYQLIKKRRIQRNPFLKLSLKLLMAYASHKTGIEVTDNRIS